MWAECFPVWFQNKFVFVNLLAMLCFVALQLGSPQAAMFKVGFYKQPPESPPQLSSVCKDFLAQ